MKKGHSSTTMSLDNKAASVEKLGKKFETLTLVDRLIEENEALKQELNLKTKRLRALQKAVHAFLMGTEDEGKTTSLRQLSREL
ncbi:MAG TPA: hypothetical protein VGE55_08240 [Limnobacter sp.]|uniref:hypothetical protein n=1 Tax=Limnobacter sp. TaxID=2003368 RepID=UPI002ED8217B